MDAHHMFPVKFETFFASKHINIHHAEYMKWWKISAHRSAAKAFNKEWEAYIISKGASSTRTQVIDVGNSLMKKYGF